MARLKVDVLVTYSTQATQAAQNATKVIPIVMSGVYDPQRTGLVAALGRPGGNVTGLSMMAPELVRLAEKTRVPDVYGIREHAEAGGLVSYGANIVDMNRRAAAFVGRIQGSEAADLPIEQSTKFELIINMAAAKTRGFAIPQSLLLRADQVID